MAAARQEGAAKAAAEGAPPPPELEPPPAAATSRPMDLFYSMLVPALTVGGELCVAVVIVCSFCCAA